MVGERFLKMDHIWKWENGNQNEIIPVHNGDIPIGTAEAILKRTGLK